MVTGTTALAPKNDDELTREQLLNELAQLRARLAEKEDELANGKLTIVESRTDSTVIDGNRSRTAEEALAQAVIVARMREKQVQWLLQTLSRTTCVIYDRDLTPLSVDDHLGLFSDIHTEMKTMARGFSPIRQNLLAFRHKVASAIDDRWLIDRLNAAFRHELTQFEITLITAEIVRVAILPLSDTDPTLNQQVEHAMVIMWDVSAQRQLEKQSQLQHQVNTLQAQEIALLKDSAQSLDVFISTVSHDIKTPLTAITNGLYLIDLYRSAPDMQKIYIQMAQDQVNILQSLIQNILTMSRLDHLAMPVRFAPVNMWIVLKSIAQRFQTDAERKGIHFMLELPPLNTTIYGSENDIERAIANLIENSIKYTPANGYVVIFAGYIEPEAAAAIELDNGATEERNSELLDPKFFINVTDTGMGISEDDLPHIFDRFFRSDSAREVDKSGSSGLGLSIVKRVVDMHKGTITVESELGKGTSITITLPI